MSNEKQYLDMRNEEGEYVSKGVYKKFLKLFEGAYIKPYGLYSRFRDDYINDLVVSFSRDYKEVARERIKAIVYESYLDKTYIKEVHLDVISAHNEALDKVFKNYLSSQIHIDLLKIQKILAEESGRKPTDEDIAYYKEVLTDTGSRNHMTLIEKYPELYMVYYREMYSRLINHLNDIAVSAETKLKYEDARSFLRKYLTEQEIKLLDESPYYILEIAEAIKKGRLDEIRSMLQEHIKSQEHIKPTKEDKNIKPTKEDKNIKPTKEDKISFYKKLLDIVIYLSKTSGNEQAPES